MDKSIDTAIYYCRVSTVSQGHDGLSIQEQRSAVAKASEGMQCLAIYTEVHSGKDDLRPELIKALSHAKATNSYLICATLDRLGRSAGYVLTILASSSLPTRPTISSE